MKVRKGPKYASLFVFQRTMFTDFMFFFFSLVGHPIIKLTLSFVNKAHSSMWAL